MASTPSVLDAPPGPFQSSWAGGLPWQRLLAAALSLALLISLVTILRHEGLVRLRGALPTSLAFWSAFALYYVALPASEWLIYRRLWNLPGAAFVALLRKLVSNEMLLGYSGELSFYLYARRCVGLATSPFNAIKDVSILSAMAGNFATLAMIALSWPIWRHWKADLFPHGTGPSLLALFALCGILLVLRRRIFSLSRADLRFIAAVHLGRVALTTFLLGAMWTAALPQVPVTTWIALAALQLVVTRLPFVPNKDIVFAGAAIWVVGAQSPLGALIAVIASLLVAAHLILGLMLIVGELVGASKEA